MADLLSIGVTGLRASQASLSVTGHNISNVNTSGFSRQSATQATNLAQFTGAGYIGTGTTLTDVRRTYSEFLTSQLRSSTALSSDVEAYKSQISQLDSLLAGSSTSVNTALQSFFSALQTAAEDPSNIPARQLVLSEAQGLAKRFNTMSDRLNQQNNFANAQMSAVSDQINNLASAIGSLNQAITTAGASGQVPNDLLDTRDEALRQLSTYVGTSVVKDGNNVSVFIGSGQPLVVGSTVNRLQITNSTGDPTRNAVQFVSGSSTQDVTSLLTGGELGGLTRYREEVLDPAMNSLGRLALTVSDQVNQQLGQGLDLQGKAGVNLFQDPNSAKQMALRVSAFSDNLSQTSGSIRISNSSSLSISDYRLEFDGTNYSARRMSDGAAINVTETGGVLSFADAQGRDQGFQMTLTGTPTAGDRFVLMPTRSGAANIAAALDQADQLAFAAPLRSRAGLQNQGTGVISQPDLQTPLDLAALTAVGVLPVSLTFTANDVTAPAGTTLTRVNNDGSAADPATFVSGQQNTYELTLASGSSLRFTLSGRPQNDDEFDIAFNQNGVSDNRNALKLADLQSKQTVGVDPNATGIATGTSFTDSYGELIERVGTLTAQANQDSAATSAILKQASDNRDSLSAVNLDEEAANLIKFEQYYNASAQIIQVARSLFDTLLSSVR
jgi:flagellar hook-associated protein 1 FlgK